ncbi:hypothetical protein [Streptomyces sp. NPDC056682]|uniref:hypothetical protein n=1 Tax=Streptomyces sp. NPDC056682 TaxID=3345909 RepID=UPI0036AD67CB
MLRVLVYPSSTGLSAPTLRFLTGQLAARRKEIGTRWRRLPAARQALVAPSCPLAAPVCAVPAAMVAVERVQSGAHCSSDVAAGAIGLASAWLTRRAPGCCRIS